jgi:hypothetical protein
MDDKIPKWMIGLKLARTNTRNARLNETLV